MYEITITIANYNVFLLMLITCLTTHNDNVQLVFLNKHILL